MAGRKLIARFLVAAVFLLLIVLSLVIFIPGYRRSMHLRSKRDQLAAECRNIEQLIEDLSQKRHRFQVDRDYVEQIARRNRRVRPGEVVFIIEPPTGKDD